MLGDHHSWGKMHYFDAAFRIPLIIRVPGRGTAGTHLSAPTESIDITPTILDLLELYIPDSMDGRSLMPLMDAQLPDDWRRFTISELDFGDPVTPTPWQTALGLTSDQCNLSVLRDERHTLVQFGGGLPPILFDHHGDGETRNIADDPSALPTRLALTEAMLAHRMTHADGQFARTMVTAEGAVRGTH
jgi:arylsulfatase A-like enzyme